MNELVFQPSIFNAIYQLASQTGLTKTASQFQFSHYCYLLCHAMTLLKQLTAEEIKPTLFVTYASRLLSSSNDALAALQVYQFDAAEADTERQNFVYTLQNNIPVFFERLQVTAQNITEQSHVLR